jgi:hypothetical protein
MNENKKHSRWWLFGIPVLIVIGGVLVSILLFRSSGIGTYPALIADAYREEQHHLNVPGSVDVKLTRTGAYGIYYEHSLADSIYLDIGVPPVIDCSLTSKSTGTEVVAVPDYVTTNRYRSNDLHTGILIMSITVDQPDCYTFICNYQDGSKGPEISVAIGPNYYWEFIRIAWKIGLPFFGGVSLLCGSLLTALIIFLAGFFIRTKTSTRRRNPN